jgi:hypothetical protein
MENIIIIKGEVLYTITLDPGVWIFDDRKVDLDQYFIQSKQEKNELEEYTKEVSAHWDREITEGAAIPPSKETEKRFQKEKVITGSFGIPLKPFLKNASPLETAKNLTVITTTNEIVFELSYAENFILGFSKDGKPLTTDGPIHIYFGDGSNQEMPIKNVRTIVID